MALLNWWRPWHGRLQKQKNACAGHGRGAASELYTQQSTWHRLMSKHHDHRHQEPEDWEVLSSAPAPPTIPHPFSIFRRDSDSKSVSQAGVGSEKARGGGHPVLGSLQGEPWKRALGVWICPQTGPRGGGCQRMWSCGYQRRYPETTTVANF